MKIGFISRLILLLNRHDPLVSWVNPLNLSRISTNFLYNFYILFNYNIKGILRIVDHYELISTSGKIQQFKVQILIIWINSCNFMHEQ